MVFNYAENDPTKQFGTEIMGQRWKELVLSQAPKLTDYNWWIVPGKYAYDGRPTIVWTHVEHTNPFHQDLDYWYSILNQFVFVSHWQMRQYVEKLNIEESKCTVIKNAIDPIPSHVKPSTDIINIYYNSEEHRGLPLVISALGMIDDPNIKLHIYRDVVDTPIPKDPRIILHGKVSNEEMKKELEQMHIFAYPSLFPEVSCISLLEAMSAGCYCIHSNYGALPETAMSLTHMYNYNKNPYIHFETFVQELKKGINNVRSGWDSSIQIQAVNKAYSWDARVSEWLSFAQKIGAK
jgi:glycosyltransferase involved in cell wall biosynthesis